MQPRLKLSNEQERIYQDIRQRMIRAKEERNVVEFVRGAWGVTIDGKTRCWKLDSASLGCCCAIGAVVIDEQNQGDDWIPETAARALNTTREVVLDIATGFDSSVEIVDEHCDANIGRLLAKEFVDGKEQNNDLLG